jgi:hypothetical protein
MWFKEALLALDVARSADLIDLVLNILENPTGLLRKPSFSICVPWYFAELQKAG